MKQAIDRMSTDEAIKILREAFRRLEETRDSHFTTLDEWKKISGEMSRDNTPTSRGVYVGSGEYYQGYRIWQGGFVFEDIPPERWYSVVVTPTAVQLSTHTGACWKWYWVMTLHPTQSRKWIAPKTTIEKERYRYRDLGMYCPGNTLMLYEGNILDGHWFKFTPATEEDLESLKLAFIKLCPKIRVGKIPELVEAAWRGDMDTVKLLIEKGAHVDVKKTPSGETALWQASWKGHIEVVKFLLENDAKVNAKRTTDRVTPLWMAAQEGHTDIVRLLLEKGAKVNVKDTDTGITELWIASSQGHTDVVRLLLGKGADVDVKRKKTGITALGIASANGHTQIVELLRQHGAKR